MLNLLILLVILVNYINFFQKDSGKLSRQIELLNIRINKEKSLNKLDINTSSLDVNIDYFFEANKTYSQSMGDMQEIINNSAKNICEVVYTKWSKTTITQQWYQYLKFDIALLCKPDQMFKFINNIKKEEKLILFKDIRISKKYKKDLLQFKAKLIGFKVIK